MDGADEGAGLIGLMRTLPLWADFSPADCRTLVDSGAVRVRPFTAGATLVEEGNYEKTFFVLLAGAVRAVRGGRVVAVMDAAGTVFGEMSFILGKGRTASVVAASPGECLVVDMGYVDYLPSPDREDFLIRIFRRLAMVVAERLGSANARKAALHAAIRSRREALRAHVAAERQAIGSLKQELAALDTLDDEDVLRALLDRKF